MRGFKLNLDLCPAEPVGGGEGGCENRQEIGDEREFSWSVDDWG